MVEKTNVLVTIVGTNPLPSYIVTANLLNQREINKIILVCSEKNVSIGQESTKELAKNVEKLIKAKYKNLEQLDISLIGISDVGEPDSIKYIGRTKLIPELKDSNEIFFDYTSGTKAMSVNLFDLLREKFRSKLIPLYLDARRFSIINEKRGGEDLRKNIVLTIDEIAGLYGYERKEKDISNTDYFHINKYYPYAVEKTLEEIVQTPDTAEEYLNWKEKNIREKFIDRRDSKKLEKEIKKKLQNNSHYILQTFLQKNVKDGKIHKFLESSYNYLQRLITDNNLTDKNKAGIISKFIKWLDGKWLEDYVYNVIKEFKKDNNNISSLMLDKNWESKRDRYGRNFELDVLAVYGYQLIAFSCTTSRKSHLCKEKGFEIFHRVKQIGGDHAKPVLITMLRSDKNNSKKNNGSNNTSEGLQEDLRAFTGSVTNNIDVLGMEDLKKNTFKKKLKQIFG